MICDVAEMILGPPRAGHEQKVAPRIEDDRWDIALSIRLPAAIEFAAPGSARTCWECRAAK